MVAGKFWLSTQRWTRSFTDNMSGGYEQNKLNKLKDFRFFYYNFFFINEMRQCFQLGLLFKLFQVTAKKQRYIAEAHDQNLLHTTLLKVAFRLPE